jgi:hypothetical protein
MGYLLPIQPIQSQQYANRMNMRSYDFVFIDRVEKVKLDNELLTRDFSDELTNSYKQDGREKGDEEIPAVSSPPLYKGFVYPNPANLSPAIAQVVGKGLSINAYV